MPAERPVRVERPALTPDRYARAESRQGVSHPVIAVLDKNLPAIERFLQGRVSTDNQAAQRYVAQNLGFLADAVSEAEPFTLEPEELVAVWSRAMEIFPDSGYSRYSLAGIVSSAYATQGLENSAWRQLPRHYLETGELPDGALEDRQGLAHVVAKFGDIDDSLGELNRYVYGSTDSGTMQARDLTRREMAGDVDAGRQLDEMIEQEKVRKTDLLSAIGENFGNGFSPLYGDIIVAVKEAEISSEARGLHQAIALRFYKGGADGSDVTELTLPDGEGQDVRFSVEYKGALSGGSVYSMERSLGDGRKEQLKVTDPMRIGLPSELPPPGVEYSIIDPTEKDKPPADSVVQLPPTKLLDKIADFKKVVSVPRAR